MNTPAMYECPQCGRQVFEHNRTLHELRCRPGLRRRHVTEQSASEARAQRSLSSMDSLRQWRCRHCGHYNLASRGLCEGCQLSRDETAWPEPDSDAQDPRESWACGRCTLVNYGGARCVACGQTRPPAASAAPPQSPRRREAGEEETEEETKEAGDCWNCPRCTLQNAASRNVCEACGFRQRPDAVRRERLVDLADPHLHPHLVRHPVPEENAWQTILQPALTLGSFGSGLSLLRGERAVDGFAQGALVGGAYGIASLMLSRAQRAQQERHQEEFRNRLAQEQQMREGETVPVEQLLMHLLGAQGIRVGRGDAQGPATNAAIASCPTARICEADLKCDDKSCPICLEDYEVGQSYRRLPCLHRFHEGCIDQWLGQKGNCPVCKMRLDS